MLSVHNILVSTCACCLYSHLHATVNACVCTHACNYKITNELTLSQLLTDSRLVLILFGLLSIDVLITIPLITVTTFNGDVGITPAPHVQEYVNVSAQMHAWSHKYSC